LQKVKQNTLSQV